MKVALIQLDTVWQNKEKNFEKILSLLNQKDMKNVDLVCLPEMFATGFTMQSRPYGEKVNGPTFAFLKRLARDFSLFVQGTCIKSVSSKRYNCSVVINPSGEIMAEYYKIHPFSFLDEHNHYDKGKKPALFTLNNFKTALFICYDLRFPELFRYAAGKGAELFIIPANWPESRAAHWRALLIARAIECQAYVLGINRTGTGDGIQYPGMSLAIDPAGNIIAEADETEQVLYAQLDDDLPRQTRKKFPFLKDMQPNLYEKLYREIKL